MKLFIAIGVSLTIGLLPAVTIAQSKSSEQKAGNCSVNIEGTGNSASLSCTNIDTTLAKEIQAILNSTLQNQTSIKDISDKLDKIINEIGAISPVSRKLSDEDIASLKQLAAMYPARIRIFYQLGDAEGYGLATQIADVLTHSGWTLDQPINGVMTFSPVPLFGMELSWKGEATPPGGMVYALKSTPQGALAMALSAAFPEEFHARQFPDMDAGLLQLDIYKNPKSKPQ